MTKKHFEAIASIINAYNQDKMNPELRFLIHSLEQDFCKYFETQNLNFNSSRFLIACNQGYK